ncbi:MAG: AAA family ATPase [Microcystaceae cyanobacterium]
MFIHRLGLKNFKCFKEVEVSFGKITLLTGENSSGKSSLIYGLLAPFQSEGFPLYLFPNGKYVNMGDFEEMSFKNKKDNIIEINIDFAQNNISNNYRYELSTQWILDKINHLPTLYYLSFLDEDEKLEINFDRNSYICNVYRYDDSDFDRTSVSLVKDIRINSLDDIDPKFVHETQEIKKISYFPAIFKEVYDNLEFTADLNFIGSYRLYPERTYYQKPKASRQVSQSGEGFIDQILEWEEKGYEEFDELISSLKDLKLLYDIKPDKLRGGRFDLRVKVKENSNWASLADVGFGVSQLLPILVADLQLFDDPTLIIAQPEIHLHPSIQAELGTYFVNQVNKLNKQYIVETHSEYLINRLRLCIVYPKQTKKTRNKSDDFVE